MLHSVFIPLFLTSIIFCQIIATTLSKYIFCKFLTFLCFFFFTVTWLKILYLFHFLYMFYNCKRTWSVIVKLKMNWWKVNCKLLFHIVKNTTILHQYKLCYNFNLISEEINNLVKTRNTTQHSHFFVTLYKNQRWVEHFFASSS